MTSYTYEELKHKTVAELREIASGIDHEAVKGYTQLRKAEIIHRLATALGIEEVVHHKVVGVDKASIKARLKELRKERDAAIEARDRDGLKRVRRQVHRLKRQIHKAMV